jgi:hypothetical protein
VNPLPVTDTDVPTGPLAGSRDVELSVNVVVAVFVPSVAVTVNVPRTNPSVAYVVWKPPEPSEIVGHVFTAPSGLVTLIVMFALGRKPDPYIIGVSTGA